MSSANQSQINRHRKEIVDLRTSDAKMAHKEAVLLSKANRAGEMAARAKSISAMQSKLREVERANNDMASLQKKRADIARKIATKSKSLQTYKGHQAKDEGKARRKAAEEQKRLVREREAHERRIKTELHSGASPNFLTLAGFGLTQAYDFFISHASEDKEGFVRELAKALRTKGANVWYDEFTLKVGDSLRQSIDHGLRNSRFGIVVLSEHFFKKKWSNKELDGLVALETQGQTRILPIWHKVSKDEVTRYSPTLADKVSLDTSLKSVDEISDDLMKLIDA